MWTRGQGWKKKKDCTGKFAEKPVSYIHEKLVLQMRKYVSLILYFTKYFSKLMEASDF